MTGTPFTGVEPDLLWPAQSGINAVLAALGLPAGSITAAVDPGQGQPVVVFSPALNPSDFNFWGGPTGAANYSAKLSAVDPFSGATIPPGSGDCVEGKAWYSSKTGALVRINTLAGADVTSTVDPLLIAEGACPATAVSPADVEFETLCDTSASGVVTEFVRRIITTFGAAGASATVFEDFVLDFSATYTPTGTVGKCNKDCDTVAPVGVVATWG